MDEIILQLTSAESIDTAIKTLTSQAKPLEEVTNNRKEYSEIKRDIRQTQIAFTQRDKPLPALDGEPAETLVGIRIPFAFQKKIVKTATAFEVGESVTLTPNAPGTLADEIFRLWKINRMDNKIQTLVETVKSETESAINFYIDKIDPTTQFNRVLGPNKVQEIKCTVFTSKGGIMAPYFDEYGDMKAFTWMYVRKIGDKDVTFTWVFTDTTVYRYSNATGKTQPIAATETLKPIEPHGFTKIPIVYLSQDRPEWYDVQDMIDRYETSFSKLGASNDYDGHPYMKIFGEVKAMPKRGDDGKLFRFDMVEDPKTGEVTHGDAEFMTSDTAGERVKLELEKLESLIYSMTNTPKLSLDDLKGLGAVSGVAMRLMFLDAIIKAKLNEGFNRTFVERILNVLISGIVNTTVVAYKAQAENLLFEVEFNSILPNDIKEIIDNMVAAKGAGLVSQETAVNKIGLTDDTDAELARIKKDKEEAAALAPATEPGTGDQGNKPPTPAKLAPAAA